MSSVLTGNASNVDAAAAFTLTVPSDGDALNAASIFGTAATPDTGFTRLADLGQWTLSNAWQNGTAATTWRLVGVASTDTGKARVYAGQRMIIKTVNAFWNDTTAKWASDDNAVASSAEFQSNVAWQDWYKGATAATWNNSTGAGAWTLLVQRDNAGNIGTPGSVAVDGIVTAAGTITTNTGNLVATAGNVTAGGAVAGSAGPGLVKGKRLYGTGTALQTSDFTLTNWGAGQSVTSVSGTDLAGHATWSAAGAGSVADPTIKITFKDGTFTTTPIVLVQLQAAPAFADLILPLVPGTINAADITFVYKTNGAVPTTGNYTMRWIVVGI